MIRRREMVSVSGGSSVYYDYEIEFLESYGTQYIDTGYKPNQNTRIVIDVKNGDNVPGDNYGNSYPKLFGCSDGTSNYTLYFQHGSRGNIHLRRGNEGANRLSTSADRSRHIYDLNKNVLYRDGVQLYEGHTNSFQCQTNLTILTLNNSNGVSSNSFDYLCCRIYSIKIYDNDVLVRDMIPVLFEGDGYMFDKVSEQLFGNAGSGSFGLGSRKIEPEENFIDLGLPSGLMWARCNLGTMYEAGIGDYYRWGSITPDGAYDTQSSGTLPLEKDAAHVNMGGDWRMPTKEECQELINNTTQTLVTVGVMNCIKVSNIVNGEERYMLLPLAGMNNGANNFNGAIAIYSSTANGANTAYGIWNTSSGSGNLFITSGYGSGKTDRLQIRGVHV